jgi:hypothetical protein
MADTVPFTEVIELVERFTGQREITSIQGARVFLAEASAFLEQSKRNSRGLGFRWLGAAIALELSRIWSLTVRMPVYFRADPIIVVVAVGALVGFILGVLSIFIFHTHLSFVAFATLAPLIVLISFTHWIFRPTPAELEMLKARRVSVFQSLANEHAAARASINEAQQRLEDAKHLYNGVILANENPKIRLLNANVGAMSGTDFEMYLADIFRFHGCQVEHIGQAGYQGVDLVIVFGTGPRIAVQAKCYGGSVSNKAVQEVYTGMDYSSLSKVRCGDV